MTSHPYFDPEVKRALEGQPSLGTVNSETLENARGHGGDIRAIGIIVDR